MLSCLHQGITKYAQCKPLFKFIVGGLVQRVPLRIITNNNPSKPSGIVHNNNCTFLLQNNNGSELQISTHMPIECAHRPMLL